MHTLRVEDFTFSAEKKGGRHVIEAPSTHEVEFTLELYSDKPIGVEFVFEPAFADVNDADEDERIIPLTKDNVIHLRIRTDRLVRVELVQPANAKMAVKAGFRELTGETKVWEQVYIHPPSYQEQALQHMVRNAVAQMVGEQPEEATDETDMEWDEDDYTEEDDEFGGGFMESEEMVEYVEPEQPERDMEPETPEENRGDGDEIPVESPSSAEEPKQIEAK